MSNLIKLDINPTRIHADKVIDYHKCPKCETEFPEMWVWSIFEQEFIKKVMCNGVEIIECPFCKP